ncbi:MAG TPA: hypothetical protein VJ861_03695 [Treponemataceae bacterium]|nr:hypothetical protein [Treponemataceae bacterium]
MAQNFKPIDGKHCYSCIQWDGPRTWDSIKKLVKVDEKKLEICRITHKKVRGESFCEHYFAIR